MTFRTSPPTPAARQAEFERRRRALAGAVEVLAVTLELALPAWYAPVTGSTDDGAITAVAARLVDVMGAFDAVQEGLGLPGNETPVFRAFVRWMGGGPPGADGLGLAAARLMNSAAELPGAVDWAFPAGPIPPPVAGRAGKPVETVRESIDHVLTAFDEVRRAIETRTPE